MKRKHACSLPACLLRKMRSPLTLLPISFLQTPVHSKIKRRRNSSEACSIDYSLAQVAARIISFCAQPPPPPQPPPSSRHLM